MPGVSFGGSFMSSTQNRKQPKGDGAYWLIAIVLIFMGFTAPIGILMIVVKLLGGKKRGRHPYDARQEQQTPVGARTTGPASRPSASRADFRLEHINDMTSKGKRLTVVGGILTAIFVISSLAGIQDAVYWLLHGEPVWFVEELLNILPILCFAGAGAGCLLVGLRRQKKAARFRQYIAMIGSRPSITLSSLSSASGFSAKNVRDDLEDMLEDGFFPGGYLDLGRDTLVLSGQGISDPPKEEPAPKPAKEEEPNQQDAVLAEIRSVNDQIDDPKLSQQIDRIGVITAKIFDYQRSHPEKSPQLHSFLSYYLPTTLKILRAYAQLEDQEVAGENITAAMHRIESMMDKVVEGFEKQLDQLFQGDALDITTDVEVLERMLSKDGLSSSDGLRLG